MVAFLKESVTFFFKLLGHVDEDCRVLIESFGRPISGGAFVLLVGFHDFLACFLKLLLPGWLPHFLGLREIPKQEE